MCKKINYWCMKSLNLINYQMNFYDRNQELQMKKISTLSIICSLLWESIVMQISLNSHSGRIYWSFLVDYISCVISSWHGLRVILTVEFFYSFQIMILSDEIQATVSSKFRTSFNFLTLNLNTVFAKIINEMI